MWNLVFHDKRRTQIEVQVEVVWVVTPCSVMVGYQCLRVPCCLHFPGEVGGCKVLWSTTWHHNPQDWGCL